MPRITNRVITDRFIAAFEKGKPFTPSEKRMMGIKLAQLKKNIKAHLESTGRETDLSVEQIILDAIEFSVMTNKPYRSIASLGFDVLDPSLNYWHKRRLLEKEQKEQEVKQTQEYVQQEQQKPNENPVINADVKPKSNNYPAWMNNESW